MRSGKPEGTAILHKLIDRIRELYSRFKPTSQIGQMTKATVKDIEGAYDRYLAGIKAVRERGTNIEKTADEGGAKYSFAGRNAKTVDIGTLSEAEQLEDEGESSEAIRQQNGSRLF